MKKSKFLKTDEPEELLVSEENLSELLEKNIKDYGMSVIEDRMIPSVRDGLKPAQRRLLKAMYDLKAWNSAPTVKSARVTGDCMGKYHPHSEAYGALANLVNQSYSLVHGQGNWGSLDHPFSENLARNLFVRSSFGFVMTSSGRPSSTM